MISSATRLILLACLLGGISISAVSAQFVPPAEGPVPFRRDRIPLDADAMAGLAQQLENFASRHHTSTPEDRRGVAQLLALAMALDPGNARARQLLNDFQNGTHTPNAPADQIERGRARLWQSIAWLETTEAGADGQALAACLKDVMVIADPKHPKSLAIRNSSSGENGKWAGWVAPLDAFKPKTPSPDMAETENAATPLPTEPPDAPPVTGIKLKAAKVTTLMWQKVGTADANSWKRSLLPLEMSAQGPNGTPDPANARLSVKVGGPAVGNAFDQTNRMLETLLKNQHDKLPDGGKITITSNDFEKSLMARRKLSITAAAAVLANSALTGVEPDAIILGQVDEKGAYTLPSSFWNQLQSLGKGHGKRLILPAAAADLIPSMLALEKPEFFMEYEVLLAENFKQLTEFSAKIPQGALASPVSRFREIHDKAGTMDLRQYIANSFVRQRLTTVVEEAPYHASARMLLIQAAGNRPTWVPRSVLAAELKRAIADVQWLYEAQDHAIKTEHLEKISKLYDTSRSSVDALMRYAEKNDRTLIENTQEMVVSIRSIDRAGRARGDEWVVREAISNAFKQFKKLYAKVVTDLTVEMGESPPEFK